MGTLTKRVPISRWLWGVTMRICFWLLVACGVSGTGGMCAAASGASGSLSLGTQEDALKMLVGKKFVYLGVGTASDTDTQQIFPTFMRQFFREQSGTCLCINMDDAWWLPKLQAIERIIRRDAHAQKTVDVPGPRWSFDAGAFVTIKAHFKGTDRGVFSEPLRDMLQGGGLLFIGNYATGALTSPSLMALYSDLRLEFPDQVLLISRYSSSTHIVWWKTAWNYYWYLLSYQRFWLWQRWKDQLTGPVRDKRRLGHARAELKMLLRGRKMGDDGHTVAEDVRRALDLYARESMTFHKTDPYLAAFVKSDIAPFRNKSAESYEDDVIDLPLGTRVVETASAFQDWTISVNSKEGRYAIASLHLPPLDLFDMEAARKRGAMLWGLSEPEVIALRGLRRAAPVESAAHEDQSLTDLVVALYDELRVLESVLA